MKLDFSVHTEENDQGFDIWCPDVPGVCAFGDTEDVAMRNMVAALNQHLECLIESNLPLPSAVLAQIERQSESLFRETISNKTHDISELVDVGVALAA